MTMLEMMVVTIDMTILEMMIVTIDMTILEMMIVTVDMTILKMMIVNIDMTILEMTTTDQRWCKAMAVSDTVHQQLRPTQLLISDYDISGPRNGSY